MSGARAIRLTAAAVLLATLPGCGGCGSKPAAGPPGVAVAGSLDGRWKPVPPAESADSPPRAGNFYEQTVIVIEGDSWSYTVGGMPGKTYRLAADPTASPKALDLTQLGRDGKPVRVTEGGVGKPSDLVLRGVYERTGDTLTVTLGEPNRDRPKAVGDARDASTMTLRRQP